jgi:ligand-binding sensor domain-containing protein
LICIITCQAQPLSCYFEHYSIEDGLPQYTIMDILQDNKGFMWFATWDGISKFDGHTFKNYKVQSGDTYHMNSNRIESFSEDKYGNIWLRSYDGAAHCFDPSLGVTCK